MENTPTTESALMLQSEQFIYEVQKIFRSKSELWNFAMIKKAMDIEDFLYGEAVYSAGGDRLKGAVWESYDAVKNYTTSCERVLRQLQERLQAGGDFQKLYNIPDARSIVMQLNAQSNSANRKSNAPKAKSGAKARPPLAPPQNSAPPPNKKKRSLGSNGNSSNKKKKSAPALAEDAAPPSLSYENLSYNSSIGNLPSMSEQPATEQLMDYDMTAYDEEPFLFDMDADEDESWMNVGGDNDAIAATAKMSFPSLHSSQSLSAMPLAASPQPHSPKRKLSTAIPVDSTSPVPSEDAVAAAREKERKEREQLSQTVFLEEQMKMMDEYVDTQ